MYFISIQLGRSYIVRSQVRRLFFKRIHIGGFLFTGSKKEVVGGQDLGRKVVFCQNPGRDSRRKELGKEVVFCQESVREIIYCKD